MDGENAVQYADAFDKTVTVVERILQSPLSLPIFLFLLVIVLASVVIVLQRRQYADLNDRLKACEQRHGTRDANLEECERRDRRNMIAIATLHGIVCTLQEALPADHPRRRAADAVQIPSLDELMSGDPAMVARYHPEAAPIS